MKIDFKKPKYVIPLIALPFVIFGYFVFGGTLKEKPKQVEQVQADGVNPEMPGVDSIIAKREIESKFTAYQEAFKNAKDESAIAVIDPDKGESNGLNYASVYTAEDLEGIKARRKMDSLNNSLKTSQKNIQAKIAEFNRTQGSYSQSRSSQSARDLSRSEEMAAGDPVLQKLLKMQQGKNRASKASYSSSANKSLGSYETQMKLFKEQMRMVDSMQSEREGLSKSAPDKSSKNPLNTKPFMKPDDQAESLPISAADNKKISQFNTVSAFSNDDGYIAAMIDQNIKVTLGSRVRIRLLKDMYVGENLIDKGTYVYGVVTGFQTQRINISIANIAYESTSLPVKIDLFDNDGYLGLYVPGSNFREFTKEIGSQSTQGLSQAVTPDNSDIQMSLLSKAFNTTTTTLASLMKKNKAYLKYNYIVYLKENKTSTRN